MHYVRQKAVWDFVLPVAITIDPASEFALNSRGIKSQGLATGFGRDMPGDVSVNIASRNEGVVELTLESRAPASGDMLYDLKVNFDLVGKEAAIKNFSIHHSANKGLNIGTTAIRNLLRAGQSPDNAAQPFERINLTAELERGAWVWGKMGWLPTENSFKRFQNKILPKLEALEQVLPASERLEPQAYAVFHTLLDSNISKNAALIWPLVDSGQSYNVAALKDIQEIMQQPREDERHDLLRDYLQQNRPDQADMTGADLAKLDKKLRFLRDLDLDGMAREGRLNTSLLLFSWERWEGSLDFKNQAQMQRLENHLQRFESRQAAQPAPRSIFVPGPAAESVMKVHHD